MPINTEREDKKTKFNFNNKNILLHWSIIFPFYPDLGKKVGNLDFGGGYSVTSDLDLGKKVGNLDLGGYSVTSDLDLGKKVGNLDLGGYSVLSDLDLGKSWKFGFFGWGGGGVVFCTF